MNISEFEREKPRETYKAILATKEKYEWLPQHKHEHQITPKDKSTQDVSKIEANILQVKF